MTQDEVVEIIAQAFDPRAFRPAEKQTIVSDMHDRQAAYNTARRILTALSAAGVVAL